MSTYSDRLAAATDAFDDARERALAARVPVADRDGDAGPVTGSGWYLAPTISGRKAWVRYTWISGRCNEQVCTYDLDAEDALDKAATAHYDAQRALSDHPEAL